MEGWTGALGDAHAGPATAQASRIRRVLDGAHPCHAGHGYQQLPVSDWRPGCDESAQVAGL